ncbi:MAG: hypothetical protein ACR2FK_03285, partial [Sphingomicrobium sp.]
RRRLADIARSGSPDQRKLARAALTTKDRYQVAEEVAKEESAATIASRLRIIPQGSDLPPALRSALAGTRHCRVGTCVVTLVSEEQALIAGPLSTRDSVHTLVMVKQTDGSWHPFSNFAELALLKSFRSDLATAPIEVRTIQRRQLFIDGRPVGDTFE